MKATKQMNKAFLHNNINNKRARKSVLNRNIYTGVNMLKTVKVKLKTAPRELEKAIGHLSVKKGGSRTIKNISIFDKKNKKM